MARGSIERQNFKKDFAEGLGASRTRLTVNNDFFRAIY